MTEATQAERVADVGHTRSGDRTAGALCLLLAAACAIEAAGFRVRFLTDPVGPRALPWLAAALIGLGGLSLLVRPTLAAAQTTMPRRSIVAFTAFFAFAALLDPLGFILTTTLLVTLLAILFEARPLHALFAGIAIAVLLWLTFVTGLGVPLPAGAIFLRGA